MRLEQLRDNTIGTTSAWIPSLGDGPESMTHLTYLQFANLAFYYSAQQIEQLEFSTFQINQGNATQNSVALWFLSIEAYINSILRISCLVEGASFDDLKKRDFDSRIRSLFDILQVDKIPFYSGPFQKLEEFKRYRNELFHDRTNDKPIEFYKTAFSGNPLFANQVDVMQAAVIAIQTFHSFRYVIPKLDLMPQIKIDKENSFFFRKLDFLFIEVLGPYFSKTLHKHSLTSDINLSIETPQLEEGKIFSKVPVEILMNAVSEEEYFVTPSRENTHIGRDLFNRVREGVSFDTKRLFEIGDFYR